MSMMMMTTVNNNILESISPFVRWLENTCVESPPLPNPEDEDEPIIVNFLAEVSKNERQKHLKIRFPIVFWFKYTYLEFNTTIF